MGKYFNVMAACNITNKIENIGNFAAFTFTIVYPVASMNLKARLFLLHVRLVSIAQRSRPLVNFIYLEVNIGKCEIKALTQSYQIYTVFLQ